MSSAAVPAAPPPAAVRGRAEIAAYRAMWRLAPPDLARRHGIAVAEIAGAVCIATASLPGAPMLNHAIGLGVAEAATDDALDAVAGFYRTAGTPFQVSAAPSATGDLGDRLLARGFAPARPWMTFHRSAGPIDGPVTSLRVAEAGPGEARAFGGIVTAAFGMPEDFADWIGALAGQPGWTCLLARDGTVPVGAAALYVDGDVAWFGLGATLPEHRGKGSQGALFAARARVAVGAGARHLVTETGAPAVGDRPGPSYRNMLRWGFAEAELRPNYASPPSAVSSTRERSTAS